MVVVISCDYMLLMFVPALMTRYVVLLTVRSSYERQLLNQQPTASRTSIPAFPYQANTGIPINLYYTPLQGIDGGNASSLPSLVLRSMLRQRRILMRMH